MGTHSHKGGERNSPGLGQKNKPTATGDGNKESYRDSDRNEEMNEQRLTVINSEIELMSNELKRGQTLVDTGAQVSLVKESSLTNRKQIIPTLTSLQGVTGDLMCVKGVVTLPVYHKLFSCKHEFFVVDDLPQNLDLIIGQDFLQKHNVQLIFDSGNLSIKIPLTTEMIIELPLKEKGDILVVKQELQEGVYLGDTLTTVNENKVIVCVINTNESEVYLNNVKLQYERPPTQ